MVAASKIFEEPLKYIHCSQIPLHYGKTCWQSFLYNFCRFTLSGFGYYAPLVLTPLLLKANKMSIENFKDILKFYFQTIFASSTTGCVTFGLICTLRNLRGEFGFWTTFLLPAFIGSQICWFFPKRTDRIFFMATTQVLLEAILRQNKNAFTYLLLNSKILQTILFMISSTIIMHYKRQRLYNGFWFIKPELMIAEKSELDGKLIETQEMENKNDKRTTKAPENIWSYLLKDSKTYFIYGFGLDMLNTVLKRQRTFKAKGLLHLLLITVKGIRFNMTCFFMSYISFYKLLLYYLPKYTTGKLSTDLQHALAAFLGGASYIFFNKFTGNTFALILAVQILWHDYCRKISESKEEKNVLNILSKIPFSQIIFPINIAYIIHGYLCNHDCINSLGKNLICAVTDKRVQQIFDYLKGHEVDSLLRDAKMKPIFGAF